MDGEATVDPANDLAAVFFVIGALEAHVRVVRQQTHGGLEMRNGVLRAVPGTAVNGERGRRVPNTTNISFDRVEAESLLIALDLEGIAVSTGSGKGLNTSAASGSLEAPA